MLRNCLSTALLAALIVSTGCSNADYKKYPDNPAAQVAAIIRGNGCLECHAADAKVPFYGKLPVIGSTVRADMVDGTRYVDFTAMLDALDAGEVVSEVDLAKLEHTVLSGSMPPLKYKAIHWGSGLDNEEKKIILSWARGVREAHYASPTVASQFRNEPLQPLPDSLSVHPEKVALGFTLYHDTRLSADNTVSCATCHDLGTAGVDRKQFSEGIQGQFGGVNAPTVYNAALNFVQFWDGRAADLREQTAGPPLNPVEMGHISFDDIIDALAQDKELTEIFNRVYPDGFTEYNVTDAIAEFEKTLLTPARFDRYLRGDLAALTPEELEGYEEFKENRCATCHVGMNIGGQSFEYMGIKSNYFDYRGTDLTEGDLGRFAVTGEEYDKHRFKTPSLRNVVLTYPYMHDGTILTIEDAIRVMHEFQIGGQIDDREMQRIVTFLHTLTGEKLL